MCEYVPPVIIFHQEIPPTLWYNSNYKSYFGRYNANKAKVYVPDRLVDTYKAAWPNNATQIYPLSEYEGNTYYG